MEFTVIIRKPVENLIIQCLKTLRFIGDYKQNVKQNWDYAKAKKQKTGQKGPVFKKNYAAMKKTPQKKANPFDGYCVFK